MMLVCMHRFRILYLLLSLDSKVFPDPHTAAVTSLTFSSDNIFIASGGENGQIKLYDTTQCMCVETFKHHTGPIRCLGFSPDSRWLFTGSDDGTCTIIDLNDSKVKYTFEHPGFYISFFLIYRLSFSLR